MTDPKIIDWPGIELQYRAGIRSLRDIGEEFGVSHVAIKKRADKEGWTRDLSAKIRAKAAELVTSDAVTKAVTTDSSVVTKAAEREVVEANAQLQANVMRDHRKTLKRGRSLVDKLLEELELVTDNADMFRRLGEYLIDDADDGAQDKRLETLAKVLSMPGRADTLKKVIESMKSVITLERDVFGISADTAPKPYEDLTPEQIKARILHLQAKAQAKAKA